MRGCGDRLLVFNRDFGTARFAGFASGVDGLRQIEKWSRVRVVLVAGGDRVARVSADSNDRIEGQLSEERYVHLLRRPLAAALAKYVDALAALGRDEVAHVLDHAEDGHTNLRKHID